MSRAASSASWWRRLRSAHDTAGVEKTDAELRAMVGTTPVIGLNDVTTEVFDLDDAAQTLTFAQENAIGMISMNRDHPCPDSTWVELTCSSTPDQQADYEFSAVWNACNAR